MADTKRGLLDYSTGLIEIPMSNIPEGLSEGQIIDIKNAESKEIDYVLKNPEIWEERDPIMNPNLPRKDNLTVVHDPNLA